MSDAVQRLVNDMRLRGADTNDRPSIAQGTGLHHVREFNRLLVLNCIREHGPIARVMIARLTGLSRTTVSSIVDTLLQEGLVREGSFSQSAPEGGRRAILVHFNADVGYVVGIDVGRSHLTLVITDLAANIIAQQSGPFDLERGPRICLPLLVAEVRVFVEAADISWNRIIGIGLGIPGPLDVRLRELSGPPGMPGWDGVDVWQILQQEFNVPLCMDNDANMGALGESRYGAARGAANMAYVKIGTGIGGGLIINGQIYRGQSGSAGELGHITIDENGPRCVCGNRGCLETLAGARAIVEDARRGTSLLRSANPNDPPEQAAPPSALSESGAVDIADVIQAALAGDAACVAALERAGERIGIALAGIINLFNPAMIVIDGGVARAGELLLTPLRRSAETCSLPAAWKGTRILPGESGTTAIALGAVSTVLEAAFSPAMTPVATQNQISAETTPVTFYRSRPLSSSIQS
jgi:glucokinase-like ROK family protein